MFGGIMALYFILKDLWPIDVYTAGVVIKAIVSGLLGGAFCGILFGYMLKRENYTKKIPELVLLENETLLLEEPANHYLGIEAVGGKIYLTDKRLVFKSHKYNIQNHEFSMPLNDIIDVRRFRNIGINNGLAVVLKDDNVEKFVVDEAQEWVDRLKLKL